MLVSRPVATFTATNAPCLFSTGEEEFLWSCDHIGARQLIFFARRIRRTTNCEASASAESEKHTDRQTDRQRNQTQSDVQGGSKVSTYIALQRWQ